MTDKGKIKSIQFVMEGNIAETRDCAESILMNMLYDLISDWTERSKYIDQSLEMAIHDESTTKLYYEFGPIEQPKSDRLE